MGWFMEVLCKLIQYRKFVNRGFLIGPYCPIYGWGSILVIVLLRPFQWHPFLLFIMAILVCSILEYATSYFMEKIFKARWWDYSQKKFHLNGRICLDTMVPFGLLSCLIVYFVHPFFLHIVEMIPSFWLSLLFYILLFLFVLDTILSFHFIYNIQNILSRFSNDNTEEITKKVKEILLHKSRLYRHLIVAYPHFRVAIQKKREIIQKKLNQEIIIRKKS